MFLLVSLCSRTDEAPEVLVVVDSGRAVVEPVSVADPAWGAFGLCATPRAIYAVFDHGRPTPGEPERSELRAFDPETLEPCWRYPFRLGRDVHSIAMTSDGLLAVSTGTDEVLRLEVDPERGVTSEEVVWRVGEGVREDRHHLNGVATAGERTLVYGFGRRPAPDAWQDARDGFVATLEGDERLLGPVYHPHSICELSADELAVCESPRRRVVTSLGRVSAPLPGYARGMTVAGGTPYVGTSRNRHPSEPLSLLPYDRSPSSIGDGIAAVCRLDPTTLAVEQVIELAPHGREVYDIVPRG